MGYIPDILRIICIMDRWPCPFNSGGHFLRGKNLEKNKEEMKKWGGV